jgi:hypothetical protein
MSRKLQLFFGGFRSSSLFQVFGFFAVFYLLRIGLSFLLAWLLRLGGFSAAESFQVLENNEIFIQTLCLLAGLWVIFREAGRSPRKFLLSELLGDFQKPWPRGRVWMASALEPWFWGFFWASVGVALALLSGFLRIEGGLAGAYWLYLLPMIFLRALGIFFWIFALELMRLKMSRLLAPGRDGDFVGNVALVIFEGSLLYSVFHTEAAPLQQALMVLVAAWMAALLSLWTMQTRHSLLASWQRVCWLSSFVIALLCFYGFPLSWGRVASLASLHEGESPWALLLMPAPTLLGQWSFIFIFSVLGCFLLRRVQRRLEPCR